MKFAGGQPGPCIGAEKPSRRKEFSAAPRAWFLPLGALIIGALALTVALLASPAFGQGRSAPQPVINPLNPPPSPGDNPNETQTDAPLGEPLGIGLWGPTALPLTVMPMDTSWLLADESCNSWTESSSRSPTVSVARLAIPGKASSEYQKGCSALKDKRLREAEEHERSAIQIYPQYAAAWVLLGQVLDAESKRAEGRTACSQARSVDPNYVAPYLCLADFAATEENWKEVSILSGSALTLDPTGNAYSFYYAADAEFHLGDLSRAEKDAQNSITLDKWHHLAQAHLLLAQIYKVKKDLIGQAAQLREYLKIAPNSTDSPEIRTALLQLGAKPSQ